MAKIFLWIAVVSLSVFIVKANFLNSSTWEPFKQGCMASDSTTEAQCDCLADYVHKHFSDNEVKLIMSNQISEPAFAQKVEEVVASGSASCSAS